MPTGPIARRLVAAAFSVLWIMLPSCGRHTPVAAGDPAVVSDRAAGASSGPDRERTPNRLVHEKSVYLAQHAYNPVDWFPWGEEAFEVAKAQGRPIFLSIGYSTCHWCHVMERESFENEEIAAYLNENFVAIKVDREERPDVDGIYMTYVTAQTGHGGWPLSVFLTLDRRPFFGGTYYPPRPHRGMPGFLDVLKGVRRAWDERRDEIERSTAGIQRFLEASSRAPGRPGELSPLVLDRAYEAFAARFDERNGGTTGAPKFPAPLLMNLLLRYEHRTGDARALAMMTTTLDAMARGGMRDHLGGGFARYSTDASWLVPHFEKMLYDNAQLARAYAEAWQRTKEPRYESVAREVLDYLLRDMRLEHGAFATAEDADSDGEEGLFYTWTPVEVREVLGDELGAEAIEAFGVTEDGHVEGRSVLHASSFDRVDAERLAEAKAGLLAARSGRVRPRRDDKVLADWNGLAVSAFAFCGRAFDEPRYVVAARDAARFVLAELRTGDGALRRRFRDGEAAITGHLSDYAFLAQGLIDLYEADFDRAWLDAAGDLTRVMNERFLDEETGTFFDVEPAPDLIVRPRVAADGAVPSGTAVAVKNLLRLSVLLADEKMRERAEGCLRAWAPAMEQSPLGYAELVNALDLALAPPREIVFAGERGAADVQALVRTFYRRFTPNRAVAFAEADAFAETVAGGNSALELLAGKRPIDGKAAAYVCERYACKVPVTDPAALDALLDGR